MDKQPPSLDSRRRAVCVWLYAVAALVFAVILVGGATRLTESGLSIVEWRPVTGALPPVSESAWQAEFEKYKAIPQYQQMNRGMSLTQFKTIYWWEWTHRFLGRLIGIVFLLPFLWFLWRGCIERGFRARLWGIFALGALQGAVGWWMVASGLSERVSVSPYRLAFHLTLACVIYAALLWIAQRLAQTSRVSAPPRIRRSAVALPLLIFLQIYIGALVAGLDAGLVYNTWPLIDGALIPSSERLLFLAPAWRNFFENELTVQFMHRILGYALWALACLHAVDIARGWRSASGMAGLLALAVTAQALIGIGTLLTQAPLLLALAHQAMAIVVLTVAVVHAARLQSLNAVQPRPASAPAAAARARQNQPAAKRQGAPRDKLWL